MKPKPPLGIIGAGRVGTSLGLLLKERGYPLVGVANRTPASTKARARLLGAPALPSPAAVARAAEVVLLTVRDEAIAPVTHEVARAGGFRAGQVVLHTSGSLTSRVLDAAREAGALALSLHPLQSCPTPEQGVKNLPGSVFSLEGDAGAYPLGEEIVRDLGGHSFPITPQAKPLYHAAACVASNYLVALLDLARQLLAAAGLPEELMVQALYPLVRGTLDNVARVGLPAALTGPVSRGDAATIAGHLEGMTEKLPGLLPLYRALARQALDLARRQGLDPGEIARLEQVLR